MPEAEVQRCSDVVQTTHGRRRCVNAANVIRITTNRQGVETAPREYVCQWHHDNPMQAQCVGLHQGGRCPTVATLPESNPQFCSSHDPDNLERMARMEAERERVRAHRAEMRRDPAQYAQEYMGTFVPHPLGPIVRCQYGYGECNANALQGELYCATHRERVDQEEYERRQRIEGNWSTEQERVDALLRIAQAARLRQESEAASRARRAEEEEIPEEPEDDDDDVVPEVHVNEDGTVEEEMPSVNFSQVARPFVAALVERLGGDVVVPARRLVGELRWQHVSAGIRFSIVDRQGVVIRSPQTTAIRVETPAPAAPAVEKKFEIEKVRDEEEFELRKLLLRCEECGLQFEKTHKTPSGADECPYCTVRLLEGKNPDAHLRELNQSLTAKCQALQEQAQEQAQKAVRLERMVQEKIDQLNEKMSTIRSLRNALETRGVVTSPLGPVPPPVETPNRGPNVLERVRQLREANPSMSLLVARRTAMEERANWERQNPAPAVAPTPIVRGGVRARLEQVMEEFGANHWEHRMENTHRVPGMTEAFERHTIRFDVPMRSQIT